MTRPIDGLRRSLAAEDPASALAFWRSKDWTGEERAAVRRAISAHINLGREILP